MVTDSPDTEFRSMFIATAYNIDWPDSDSEPTDKQKSQMISFLETTVDINFNAIMFQVHTDALTRWV